MPRDVGLKPVLTYLLDEQTRLFITRQTSIFRCTTRAIEAFRGDTQP